MRKIVSIFVVLSIFFVQFSSMRDNAEALSCVPGINYDFYSDIFAGSVTTVTEINESTVGEMLFGESKVSEVYEISVSEVFVGNENPNTVTNLTSDSDSVYWGYELQEGQELLIFANRREDGNLYYELCNPSISLDSAGSTLDTLRALDNFNDISDSVFKYNIASLSSIGIVGGFGDGSFRPNEKVTRGQFAKFIANGFGFKNDFSGEKFHDIQDMTDEINIKIQTLKNNGIINGFSDNTFRKDEFITRGAVTKFVENAVRAKGVDIQVNQNRNFPEDISQNVFSQNIENVMSMSADGFTFVMNGYPDGNFYPDRDITRGEVSKVVDLAREYVKFGLNNKSFECIGLGGSWDESFFRCDGINNQQCSELGGEFNECASACPENDATMVCVTVCVQACEF